MKKASLVTILAVLCALGLVALAVVRWFPEWRVHAAFLAWAIFGGWGGLAALGYGGARKIFRRNRGEAANVE